MTTEPEILYVCVHNAGRSVDEVRPIVDEIEHRVIALIAEPDA